MRTALKFDTTSAARAGSVVTLSKVALSPVTVAPLIFRPEKAPESSLSWSSIGVIVLPQAAAAPGMLVIVLPPVAMSSQTVLPSPATMEPSHEVIAASGVDWSTATGVAAVVESPVALPELAPDGVDDVDDVDDDVVDAAGVVLEVVPVVPVA